MSPEFDSLEVANILGEINSLRERLSKYEFNGVGKCSYEFLENEYKNALETVKEKAAYAFEQRKRAEKAEAIADLAISKFEAAVESLKTANDTTREVLAQRDALIARELRRQESSRFTTIPIWGV